MNFLLRMIEKLPQPKEDITAFGIDLGTTNSTVAEVKWPRNGKPTFICIEIDQPTREGIFTSPLVPSVVVIRPDKKIWVGEGAKRLRAYQEEFGLSVGRNLFYETKNDMGLRKTYSQAPESFNHASKIAGKILEFLAEQASVPANAPLALTVPACFQLNQRRDTLGAARMANLGVNDDDLLEEPTAALIDHLFAEDSEIFEMLSPKRILSCLVFDFGGGTCDVTVSEISLGAESESGVEMSPLSISRYHRLGGGDIDAAIVHELLIPRLLEENGLKPLDLTWAQKKRKLEPQLLSKAEALKIALCLEIDRRKKFNQYENTDKPNIIAQQPLLSCTLDKQTLSMKRPQLTAAEFELILEPFLDTDMLYARETEYRITQSIFAPLQDALDRADKSREEIDFCLMVGGSSLIPRIREAVSEFFPNAKIGGHKDPLDLQLAVARGAAWHAALRSRLGTPLIKPMLNDGIALLVEGGKEVVLIPQKSPLPYPQNETFLKETLSVPASDREIRELRIEIISERDRQGMFNEVWQLPPGVKPNDKIIMEYRITAGKSFECSAYLPENPSHRLSMSIENPLVNVFSPNEIKVRIEEAEEELRARKGGNADDRDSYIQLARWYAELNQREKALEYLKTALMKLGKPDPSILNLRGIYFSELGDFAKSERAYREAARVAGAWGGPLFNLALEYLKRKSFEKSTAIIEEMSGRIDENGPSLVLKGLNFNSIGREKEGMEAVKRSVKVFGPPEECDEWELGWFLTAAKTIKDADLISRIKKVMHNRKKKTPDQSSAIHRPDIRVEDMGTKSDSK